jgi:queuine tRNA-ribosyltransferase
MLAMRLAVLHNLFFYNTLMARIRDAIDNGEFDALRQNVAKSYEQSVNQA